ncbi:hypothetical protein C0992_009877, partial [Termitomyces sp. T32_za158]
HTFYSILLIPQQTSSSPIAALNTSKKGISGLILAFKTHGTKLNHHDVDIAEQGEKIQQINNENQVLHEELDALQKKVSVQEKAIQSLDMKLESFEEIYTATREKKDDRNSSNSSNKDFNAEDGMTSLTERKKAAMEVIQLHIVQIA